jgi:hypothetical protein
MRPSRLTSTRARTAAVVASAVLGLLVFASGAQAKFGIVPGSLHAEALNENGTIDTQAGSHPHEYVVSFDFNLDGKGKVEGNARDIYVELPPGLVGDPGAVPKCTRQEFEGVTPECSDTTQVGFLTTDIQGLGGEIKGPLYNMVPPAGAPASLGFAGISLDAFINAGVRSGGDYGITVATNNIPQEGVATVKAIVWGVPAEESYTPERGCVVNHHRQESGCKSGIIPKPFLTLPTSCNGPLLTRVKADSYEAPEELVEESALSLDAGGEPAGLSGCEALAFEPSLEIAPDTTAADTPAGLTAEVHAGQGGLEAPAGFSAANIKNTTVTLPEGMAINPGQAAGLQACPPGRPGPGREGDALSTQAEKERGEEDTGPPSCPNASKVGTVRIRTPLLEEELTGNVYVLPSDPPNLELLVAPSAPIDGIYVKLVGKVHLNETTGQIVTTFSETPQLPFTSFQLSFSGGAKAAVTTPLRCGVYTTNTDFTPWSTPFTADLLTSDSFAIASGPLGAPCPPSPPPFAPSLIAGASTDQAGGFTDFSLLLARPDDQQRIEKLQFKAPAGLLAALPHVTLCPEPQAREGDCPPSSQIGHTVVEAGPGPDPLVVPEPGQPPAPIYLTGQYENAPFGLSIVVPLHVGPFTLETQKVRAKIEVDPRTAQLTVTTDPLPRIVDGVPSDLRTIDAVIDRPGFMINPTNCDPQSFSGTATSYADEGAATAAISSPFGVGSCRSLGFSPSFTATASGKTSKANGASLSATLSYPSTPPERGQATSQANIARVRVELPKQLPSRLTTLQKACTAAQFGANPAGCPVASVVGQAVVHTPVLPVPLTGPAYFVSHGGEAFPSLIVVLQGYGVTVDVEATTFISKAGVTSLTFKSAPDAPFSSFTLISPQGPFSALTANGNLCAPARTVSVKQRVTVRVHGHIRHLTRTVKRIIPETLVMPTELVAQNGAVLKQSTKVGVTGCPKIKKKTKKAKKATNNKRASKTNRAPKR